jgi:hypothetical protein
LSTYIHAYDLLNAVKTKLDADSTLDGLLNVGDVSKVIIGAERPIAANLPCVHLSVLTRSIQTETKLNTLLLRVAWFVTQLEQGTEDVETLSDIGERIYDLLDDAPPTVTGYRIDAFVAESGETIAKDMIRPEGLDNHFDTLTFRVSIRRVA